MSIDVLDMYLSSKASCKQDECQCALERISGAAEDKTGHQLLVNLFRNPVLQMSAQSRPTSFFLSNCESGAWFTSSSSYV